MSIVINPTRLPEVLHIRPRVFDDERGFFLETYREEAFLDAGISDRFVQDNHSHSRGGVLRGLHYQMPNQQAKLICVSRGEISDVAVDIRRGSPRFGQWVSLSLSSENHDMVYIPPGFAHGFVARSESADVLYKCSEVYVSESDRGISWSDPAIGIEWNVEHPMLSAKDARLPLLADVPEDHLPVYSES